MVSAGSRSARRHGRAVGDEDPGDRAARAGRRGRKWPDRRRSGRTRADGRCSADHVAGPRHHPGQPVAFEDVPSRGRRPRPSRSACFRRLYAAHRARHLLEMRVALPVGGGGPNTPSLSSSDMVKMVSHERQWQLSFFSGPNQPGRGRAAWARMVPGPAESRAAPARSGGTPAASDRGDPSSPRWAPADRSPRRPARRRGSAPDVPTRSSSSTAVLSRSPLPEKYRPTAGESRPGPRWERCKITGVAPAPAASTTILASIVPSPTCTR